jgi:hypothetical protein
MWPIPLSSKCQWNDWPNSDPFSVWTFSTLNGSFELESLDHIGLTGGRFDWISADFDARESRRRSLDSAQFEGDLRVPSCRSGTHSLPDYRT